MELYALPFRAVSHKNARGQPGRFWLLAKYELPDYHLEEVEAKYLGSFVGNLVMVVIASDDQQNQRN